MQKLSGKSIVMLYKSCRVSHKESNKIECAFLWFSMIFYGFTRISQTGITIFDSLQTGPCFANRPLERLKASQLGPPMRAGGGPANSRWALAGDGWGRSWGGANAREGTICGRNGARTPMRRRQAAAVVGTAFPTRRLARRATRGAGGCSGRSWWQGCAQTTVLWLGVGSSPWWRLWRTTAASSGRRENYAARTELPAYEGQAWCSWVKGEAGGEEGPRMAAGGNVGWRRGRRPVPTRGTPRGPVNGGSRALGSRASKGVQRVGSKPHQARGLGDPDTEVAQAPRGGDAALCGALDRQVPATPLLHLI
jgi:hypothetical protein